MERKESTKFFLRFLLLTVITFIIVTISVVLSSAGGVGLILGGILVVINVFFLLTFLVISVAKLFKHIFDKEKDYFDFMYLVNFLFAFLITAVFLTFYFVILASAMIFLLPFIA